MTQRVVMFSGGLGSWATARRVVERHGADDLTLLFCDTLIEDEDLYRFLDEAATDVFRNMPVNLVRIAEGRTPWQIFNDEGMIGNTRADLCSRILKRELADKWLAENCDPAETIIYLGIDWTERHRFDDGEGGGAKARYERLGWRCEAPLCEPPWLATDAPRQMLREAGIRLPRLYRFGWPHDNCGGFCIKQGHGGFALLLKFLPDRYEHHAGEERAFRARTGKDVAILRDRRGGDTVPLTLDDFRQRVESGAQIDLFDLGGCGCFSGDTDPQPKRTVGT